MKDQIQTLINANYLVWLPQWKKKMTLNATSVQTFRMRKIAISGKPHCPYGWPVWSVYRWPEGWLGCCDGRSCLLMRDLLPPVVSEVHHWAQENQSSCRKTTLSLRRCKSLSQHWVRLLCITSVVPVAERMLFSPRQRRQLWRVDVDRVLTTVGFIKFYQSSFLWPFTIHLVFYEKHNKHMCLISCEHSSIAVRLPGRFKGIWYYMAPLDEIIYEARGVKIDTSNECICIRGASHVSIPFISWPPVSRRL